MSIAVHPEASKRFNELANSLLAKVTPEPPFASGEEPFHPDVPPVAEIPEHDIIGDVREVKSIVDGTGEEVGRFFEHVIPRVGLIGDSFKALTQLVVRIHELEGVRDTTSVGFIRDTAFEWLEGKYRNTITESCSDYVLTKAEQEIKDFEIWIPLYRTYIESSFQIGAVVFRTIASEMLDKWHSNRPEVDAESIAAMRLAFARERSILQGCAAAVVKIRAERGKAVAVAREQGESATALLRFVSLANWTPKLRSYCTLLGSENVRQRAELFIQGDSIVSYSRGVLDDGTEWILSNSYLAHFPGVLDRLNTLSDTAAKTPFQQILYDALLIYSRNSAAIEPADKLIYILVALESVLLRNENEPLGKNIGERLAFLVGNSLQTRKEVLANAVEIYRLRSAFIHHGHSIQDIEVLQTFMLNVWTCFNNLLVNVVQFKTKDELIASLEDRKMA
jgi:hypothetical protein